MASRLLLETLLAISLSIFSSHLELPVLSGEESEDIYNPWFTCTSCFTCLRFPPQTRTVCTECNCSMSVRFPFRDWMLSRGIPRRACCSFHTLAVSSFIFVRETSTSSTVSGYRTVQEASAASLRICNVVSSRILYRDGVWKSGSASDTWSSPRNGQTLGLEKPERKPMLPERKPMLPDRDDSVLQSE